MFTQHLAPVGVSDQEVINRSLLMRSIRRFGIYNERFPKTMPLRPPFLQREAYGRNYRRPLPDNAILRYVYRKADYVSRFYRKHKYTMRQYRQLLLVLMLSAIVWMLF